MIVTTPAKIDNTRPAIACPFPLFLTIPIIPKMKANNVRTIFAYGIQHPNKAKIPNTNAATPNPLPFFCGAWYCGC